MIADTGVGIAIMGPTTTGNLVQGNKIGTDITGTARLSNNIGISFGAGSGGDTTTFVASSRNTIGGTTPGAGNLISGNQIGVFISNTVNVGNTFQGNLIGTDATGSYSLGNAQIGMLLINAGGNTIGGTTAGARNVISANLSVGLQMTGPGTTGNLVQGNFIGTDITGTRDHDPLGQPLGNGQGGIFFENAPANTLGGKQAGARNLISGNGFYGVRANGSLAPATRSRATTSAPTSAAPRPCPTPLMAWT